jgi:hypothetical protein
MKIFASVILFLCLPGLLPHTRCGAADWALPAKYDMSFPYLKAYRYGPMLGGIGTGGLSFGTMGLSNFRVFIDICIKNAIIGAEETQHLCPDRRVALIYWRIDAGEHWRC